MTMYFDDCSRLEDAEGFLLPIGVSKSKAPHVPWVPNEKLQAVRDFLGYTAQSALKLEPEQVEEALLQWAIDTNIVDYSEEEEEDTPATGSTMPHAKFDSISDLSIAPCTGAIACLAYFWQQLASLLDHPEAIPANSVHLMAFPNATALWNYDVMLTMMQAVQVSKPFLRHEEYTLQLHLFHPDFKHSPKFLSPETHAPFPTAGFSLVKKTFKQQPTFQVDATRSKLEAIFQKEAATPQTSVLPPTLAQVWKSCQPWIQSNLQDEHPVTQHVLLDSNKKHHWFATVWSALSALQPGQSIVVVGPADMPRFSTWRKWAIVMNAALKRLTDGNMQIAHVAHPSAPQSHRQSPHPVLQIVFK
jgi:hypothetical protein